MIRAAWALLAIPAAVAAQSTPDIDPVSGYRVAHYRAVVPSAPEGVERIDAARVADMIGRRHAILIDVMPAEGGVRDPVTGQWRLAEPRESLPGSHWFPEAGRGKLDPGIARWFGEGIASLRSKTAARPLILFCLADCWMSWNAARRLHLDGYRNVYWFADGTDGWRDLGKPLVAVQPFGSLP